MHGKNISEYISKKSVECLHAMYNEDSQAFTQIVNLMSQEEVAFANSLFSGQ